MNIEILFENSDLLVINKPTGLVVHGDGKTDEPTVVDWVLEHYPEIQGVGENMFVKKGETEIELNRPGIVHRIDRDTSGCLVIAKTETSFQRLKQQFKDRLVKKTYLAVVYGWPKESGDINAVIGRSAKDFRMKQAGPSARGHARDAFTSYKTLSYYEDLADKDKQGKFERYALVECRPKTGRTHQIRVHLKFINHPIVADGLYRGKRKKMLGLDRTALHAAAIEIDGVQVTADVPTDMQGAIDRLVLYTE